MSTDHLVPPGTTSAPEDPGSLEGQLHALYAERELLTAELGTADPAELVELVRSAQPLDESLVEQLESLYAEREQVQQAIGVSSSDDVIALVRRLQQGGPRSLIRRLRSGS